MDILPVVQDEGGKKQRDKVFAFQEITVHPGEALGTCEITMSSQRVWNPELLLKFSS